MAVTFRREFKIKTEKPSGSTNNKNQETDFKLKIRKAKKPVTRWFLPLPRPRQRGNPVLKVEMLCSPPNLKMQ